MFPRAIGTSQGTDLNCYYIADGNVVAATVNSNHDCTEIYKTDFDRQGFEQEWQERPKPVFVETTLEELTSLYVGQNIQDY